MRRKNGRTIAESLGVVGLALATAAVLMVDGLSSQVARALMHGLCAVGETTACAVRPDAPERREVRWP